MPSLHHSAAYTTAGRPLVAVFALFVPHASISVRPLSPQADTARAVHAAAIANEQIGSLKEELALERTHCAELESNLKSQNERTKCATTAQQ